MTIFKKHTAAFMALAMLAMQLLLAQHYTVHFSQDDNITVGQNHKGSDHKPDPDKICQVCLFSKNFSQTVDAGGVHAPLPPARLAFIGHVRDILRTQTTIIVYSARGPPAFLS